MLSECQQLQKHSVHVLFKPSTQCIVEAVKICLEHNNSQFENTNYLQIHGTAMDPKNACSYADLAMSEIDERVKSNSDIKPNLWWRFRDDGFIETDVYSKPTDNHIYLDRDIVLKLYRIPLHLKFVNCSTVDSLNIKIIWLIGDMNPVGLKSNFNI